MVVASVTSDSSSSCSVTRIRIFIVIALRSIVLLWFRSTYSSSLAHPSLGYQATIRLLSNFTGRFLSLGQNQLPFFTHWARSLYHFFIHPMAYHCHQGVMASLGQKPLSLLHAMGLKHLSLPWVEMLALHVYTTSVLTKQQQQAVQYRGQRQVAK